MKSVRLLPQGQYIYLFISWFRCLGHSPKLPRIHLNVLPSLAEVISIGNERPLSSGVRRDVIPIYRSGDTAVVDLSGQQDSVLKGFRVSRPRTAAFA